MRDTIALDLMPKGKSDSAVSRFQEVSWGAQMLTARAPALPQVSGDRALVLLADRDDDSRQMYGEYLKQSGLDVEEAADGRLALAKALSIRPDIVVTETRLFGIDGYDLCQLLRRDATTVGIPIVVVTADAYQREGERERSGAADVVLLKPCLPNVLLSEIRGLIQRSRDLRRQSEELRARLATQLTRPRALHGGLVEKRRRTPARVYDHLSTTLPELVPPTVACPNCLQPLLYRRSHSGGVNERSREQWDYYECAAGCGTFQYRQRTRKLRNIS